MSMDVIYKNIPGSVILIRVKNLQLLVENDD